MAEEVATQRKVFRYQRLRGIDVTAETAAEPWRPDPFIGLQPMAWWFYGDLERLDWLGKPPDFAIAADVVHGIADACGRGNHERS